MIPKIPAPQYNEPPKPEPIRCCDRQKLESRKAADALICGFDWRSSAEGISFWSGVYDRLAQISQDGIIKDF